MIFCNLFFQIFMDVGAVVPSMVYLKLILFKEFGGGWSCLFFPCVCVSVAKLYPSLWDPMECSPHVFAFFQIHNFIIHKKWFYILYGEYIHLWLVWLKRIVLKFKKEIAKSDQRELFFQQIVLEHWLSISIKITSIHILFHIKKLTQNGSLT